VGSYFVVIAGFLLAERLLPAERNQPWWDLVFSAGCTVFGMIATPFAIVLPSKVAEWAAPRIHGPLLNLDLNRLQTGIPGFDWPLVHLVLPLVPLFVFDFFYYWHHRLQHRIPVLWEQHQLHRILHSRQPEHRDKNFAAFFPVWDLLFGTYCRAKPGEWPATGLFEEERRATLSDAVIGPFAAWATHLRATSSRPSSTRRVRGTFP